MSDKNKKATFKTDCAPYPYNLLWYAYGKPVGRELTEEEMMGLNVILSQLSDAQQEVVYYRFSKNLGYREIGRLLGRKKYPGQRAYLALRQLTKHISCVPVDALADVYRQWEAGQHEQRNRKEMEELKKSFPANMTKAVLDGTRWDLHSRYGTSYPTDAQIAEVMRRFNTNLLDDSERRILIERFKEHKTLQDISLENGCTREAIRQKEHRALRRLATDERVHWNGWSGTSGTTFFNNIEDIK